MLHNPSPRMSPLANTMMGVSGFFKYLDQYKLINPPIALANVNEGVLYIPGQQSVDIQV